MFKLKTLRFSKSLFNIGNVLKVYYVVFFKKKKRVYSFIGFCFFKNKTNFKLVNVIKKQKIIMTLTERSPFILKIFNLKIYRIFVKRVCKLYFKTRSHFEDDYNSAKNKIVSSYNSFKARYFTQAYFKRRRTKNRRRHKLKLKFKRAESWFYYLNKNFRRINIFQKNDFFLNFVKEINHVSLMRKLFNINNNFFLNKNTYNINLKNFFNSNGYVSLLEVYDEVYDEYYGVSWRGDTIFNNKNWIKVILC